ncbi:MAG: hypothetical protein GXX93_03880 [Anaerolineae bacterium]|nr:hypothetical protein [Anaerolineae bacterium]
MDRPSTKTIVYGALVGGVLGAALGAIMAARSGGHRSRRPSATEATAIGMTTLGLLKQMIDAFS